MKAHIGSRGWALLFFRPGARCGQVVNATPQPPYLQERDPAPSYRGAEWAPGLFWKCGKLSSHQDSIPESFNP